MRPIGRYTYSLFSKDAMFLEMVESGVFIRKGDELNWNGNRLYVNHVEGNYLTVEKIGESIVVKNIK